MHMGALKQSQNSSKRVLFAMGSVVATPGALACLERCGIGAGSLLARHQTGDWGDLCDEDRVANEQALKSSLRVLSSYTLQGGARIWIITEADRSVTTLLLPEEY
jgi:hypothetical protein